MRVFVTDGDNRAALAIVRSLGRAGHWVAVGERSPQSLAQSSKYCARAVQYPDPTLRDCEFVRALRKTVHELNIDVLLPVTDVTTLLVTTHRRSFPTGCRIPFADADTIARAADKVGVLRTAERVGVPTPRTVVLDTSDTPTAGLDLRFPLVLKPARSRVRTPDGWISCRVSYAADEGELAGELAARRPAEFPLALQEKVVGPGIGAFFCCHEGVPVAEFAHRRLREKPPSGGVSVLCESVQMSPLVREYSIALLRELHWEGVAMIEFKLDQHDGVPKLMEINGRFWGSLQLAIDAGVDFPRILLDAGNGRVPVAHPAYRVGIQNRWLWGDFDSLLIRIFGRSPSSAVGTGVTRVEAVAQFLRFWGRGLHYENPKWDDLRPWLYETRSWLKGER